MTNVTIFYIDDFQIDLSRSTVTKGEHQTQVEPKVLKVLLLLAQQQNKVVTHQEIMDQIWQGTEVVPNALQRCIAILRKALNDDAKAPSVIATHPRIGYSLLAEVRWQTLEVDEKNTEQSAHQNKVSQSSNWKHSAVALVISFVAIAAILHFFGSHSSTVQYTKLRLLTQTDAHESHAIYSPSADYIVFNRYAGSCKSHVWAKQVSSGKETQLTAKPGHFGAMSFTDNGRELVFSARERCGKDYDVPVPQTNHQLCWNIATMDFASALSAPKTPNLRHQCQAERLIKPKALPNHQYTFLQYKNGRYQLIHYDDLTKKLKELYASSDEYIYHFDYNSLTKRFAVVSRDKQFNHVLTLLDETGALQSRKNIQLIEGTNRNTQFFANFEPEGKYLLSVNGHKLQQLDLDGQLSLIVTPENNIQSVAKHPTENELLMVTGAKDIDIAQISLGDKPTETASSDLSSHITPYASVDRTAAQERNAQYQPNGELIAFISDRSGHDQLWLWQQNNATQLSFNESPNAIENFSWSPNGERLAWVNNEKLTIADVDGNLKVLDAAIPLNSVLSWYSDNQMLVQVRDPAPGGLYRLNLKNNELTAFGINHVKMAWVHNTNLYYTHSNGDLYLRSLDEKNTHRKHLPNLNGNALFIENDAIYSVDSNNFMLNQYDLDGQLIQALMPLPPQAWKVSGLKGKKLLLSQFIAINQEIVVLE